MSSIDPNTATNHLIEDLEVSSKVEAVDGLLLIHNGFPPSTHDGSRPVHHRLDFLHSSLPPLAHTFAQHRKSCREGGAPATLQSVT